MSEYVTRCTSCGAAIDWALTPQSRAIPLDPAPTPDGNLAVWRDIHGHLQARALILDEEPAAHEHRGTSHFATCPNAAAHRRPRGGR